MLSPVKNFAVYAGDVGENAGKFLVEQERAKIIDCSGRLHLERFCGAKEYLGPEKPCWHLSLSTISKTRQAAGILPRHACI
ncbi:hypothetical protein MVEN_00349100 [Mycena venus]|uniref:Uncharacterized protein n=1 Tax=Mycena venus TaxID=2733690 RepID=A0A8H6YUZ1_9AGAR|nr:hypothetical protein MVEN_00349100 [Mycena venus]